MLSNMGVNPEKASFCAKSAIYKGLIKITGDPKELDMAILTAVASCGHFFEAKLSDVLNQPDYVIGTKEDIFTNEEKIALYEDPIRYRKYLQKVDRERRKAGTLFCYERPLPPPDENFPESDSVHEPDENRRAKYFFYGTERRPIEPRDCIKEGVFYFIKNLCGGVPLEPQLNYIQGHKHCRKCPRFGRCVFYADKHCDDCGKHYVVDNSWGKKCQCKEEPCDRIRESLRSIVPPDQLEAVLKRCWKLIDWVESDSLH